MASDVGQTCNPVSVMAIHFLSARCIVLSLSPGQSPSSGSSSLLILQYPEFVTTCGHFLYVISERVDQLLSSRGTNGCSVKNLSKQPDSLYPGHRQLVAA